MIGESHLADCLKNKRKNWQKKEENTKGTNEKKKNNMARATALGRIEIEKADEAKEEEEEEEEDDEEEEEEEEEEEPRRQSLPQRRPDTNGTGPVRRNRQQRPVQWNETPK